MLAISPDITIIALLVAATVFTAAVIIWAVVMDMRADGRRATKIRLQRGTIRNLRRQLRRRARPRKPRVDMTLADKMRC
jgi:hypothetical protein